MITGNPMLETLLAAINEAHSTSLQLGSRYADGEQGAYGLVDSAGQLYVRRVTEAMLQMQKLDLAALQAAAAGAQSNTEVPDGART